MTTSPPGPLPERGGGDFSTEGEAPPPRSGRGPGGEVVLLALLLLLAPAARADTLYWLGAKLGNGATLPDGGGDPFPFYIDETQSSPGGLPVAGVESDFRAAFQRWQDVSCAYIGFRYAGAITDPGQLGDHTDSKSVMATFISDRNDPRYAEELGGGVAVGVALTLKTNGVIQACDTEYNYADWHYSESGDASAMDFPSLANHESGHCLGLDHDPNDPTSVMYPNVANGEQRRTLDAHDVDNVCQLYPETGALGSPCAGNSCGSGLTCINNPTAGGNFCSHGCDPQTPSSCEAGFGCKSSSAISGSSGACFPGVGDQTALVGAACSDASTCNGTLALCLPPANGWPDGYCSQLCDSNACPTGNVCVALGDGHNYCLSACSTVHTGCRAGYACYAQDAAGDGFCYPACSTDNDCGAGNSCLCNGVCTTPGNPQAFVGSHCAHNVDCFTGGFCIPETLNGTATGWSAGYCSAACGGTDRCVSCPDGSACVVDGAEGQAYCLQTCDAHGGCRTGYSCVQKGGAQVCEPGSGPHCVNDNGCPVGDHCVNGACQAGGTTGGCSGALCDGGVDASTTGSGGTTGSTPQPAKPGGCGCTQTDGAGLLGLLLVLAGARRRTW